jgi:hypothetical protein
MSRAVTKFDWSSWDRESIVYMVGMIKDAVVNQKISPDKFHTILTRHIKKYLPIRTRKSKESAVTPTWIFVGGMYYTDYDINRKKSIELCLAYNDKDKTIPMTTRRFNRICWRIADVILHEIIHMRQARKRKFKSLPGYSSTAESTKQRVEQEYLGDDDEIDAYAYNLACELTDKFGGDMTKIANYLNEEQKGKRRIYDTWRTYLKAFDYDHNHRIIKKLKKRSIYYLSRSQISKPFHSKDWIHR